MGSVIICPFRLCLVFGVGSTAPAPTPPTVSLPRDRDRSKQVSEFVESHAFDFGRQGAPDVLLSHFLPGIVHPLRVTAEGGDGGFFPTDGVRGELAFHEKLALCRRRV